MIECASAFVGSDERVLAYRSSEMSIIAGQIALLGHPHFLNVLYSLNVLSRLSFLPFSSSTSLFC